MTTIRVDIGDLVVRDPEIRNGKPRISGTGVTVQRIVSYYKLGLDPEEIADQIGHLSYAQVYAALTYYHANREEIEDAIKADTDAGDSAEADWRGLGTRIVS